jgi:hypothetical protein
MREVRITVSLHASRGHREKEFGSSSNIKLEFQGYKSRSDVIGYPLTGRRRHRVGMRALASAIGSASVEGYRSGLAHGGSLLSVTGDGPCLPQLAPVERDQSLPVAFRGRPAIAPPLWEGKTVMDAGVEFDLTGGASPPE